MTRMEARVTTRDQDDQKGAIEGNGPAGSSQGNANAPGLDEQGMPDDPVAQAEDVVGANEDGTEG